MSISPIMIPSNQDDVVYRRRRLPSRHVEDEENKYDADDEWATEATRLLENHYDNEERHEIVDLLIDCMQTLYAGINQRIAQVKPHRKAYSFFFSEKQPMVAKVHKIRGHAEKFQIAKKVAKWWTILSSEEKAVYLTAEHSDRTRFNDEVRRHHANQIQLVELIDWIESNRTFITSWPTDLISTWSKMVMQKAM